MLLWLTLTVLWSTTCWADRKSGWVCLPPAHAPGSGLSPGLTLVSGPAHLPGGLHPVLQKDNRYVTVSFSLSPSPGSFVHLEMYGNGRGTYFSSSPDNTNDISGIRVSLSPIGIIRR